MGTEKNTFCTFPTAFAFVPVHHWAANLETLGERGFHMRCKYGPNHNIFCPNKHERTLLCGRFSVNYIAKGQISSAGIMQNPIHSGRPRERSKMIDESQTSAKSTPRNQSPTPVPYNRILSSKIIILHVINNHAKKGQMMTDAPEQLCWHGNGRTAARSAGAVAHKLILTAFLIYRGAFDSIQLCQSPPPSPGRGGVLMRRRVPMQPQPTGRRGGGGRALLLYLFSL